MGGWLCHGTPQSNMTRKLGVAVDEDDGEGARRMTRSGFWSTMVDPEVRMAWDGMDARGGADEGSKK